MYIKANVSIKRIQIYKKTGDLKRRWCGVDCHRMTHMTLTGLGIRLCILSMKECRSVRSVSTCSCVRFISPQRSFDSWSSNRICLCAKECSIVSNRSTTWMISDRILFSTAGILCPFLTCANVLEPLQFEVTVLTSLSTFDLNDSRFLPAWLSSARMLDSSILWHWHIILYCCLKKVASKLSNAFHMSIASHSRAPWWDPDAILTSSREDEF